MKEAMGIFYFSGTGNSKYVAEYLHHAFDRSMLIKISDEVKSKAKYTFEIIGIVVPTYYLGVPKMVFEFLERADIQNCDYLYVITTKGWSMSGGAIKQLQKLLSNKGLTIDYGQSIVMPYNDFDFGKVDSKEKQMIKLNASERLLEKIVDDITGKKKKIQKEPMSVLTYKRHAKFLKEVNAFDKYFSYTDACNGCGLCVKTCPAENIELHKEKPIWLHHCESCLACYNYCPNRAITYKESNDENTYYKHPKVNIL